MLIGVAAGLEKQAWMLRASLSEGCTGREITLLEL